MFATTFPATSTYLRLSLITLLTASLCACVSYQPLQRSQTAGISKGLSSANASQVIRNATLLARHNFDYQGQQFRADHYDLQTGVRQQMFTHCPSRRRACVPVIQSIPVTDWYVVIYRADQVYAWGIVEELSRSPDDNVSGMMPELKRAYAALKAGQ